MAKKVSQARVPVLPGVSSRVPVSFRKVITRPGPYHVRKAGKKVPEDFDEARLRKIAANINDVIAAGLKIPAPFMHRDKDNRIPLPTEADLLADDLDVTAIGFDPAINGGHWQSAEYVDDVSKIDAAFKPGPGLVGVVNSYGDPNDPNTPAGKIGTTAQDTSLCVLEEYTDGAGRQWKDYPAHIAIPMHAIEPGQDNFSTPYTTVSMSDMIDMADKPGFDKGDGKPPASTEEVPPEAGAQVPISLPSGENPDAQFAALLSMLRQAPIKLDLPPETKPDNFVQVLSIVVRQKVADMQEMQQDDSVTTPPAGSNSRPAPIAMSDSENTMSQDRVIAALLSDKTNTIKRGLHKRVARLVGSGVISKADADLELIPHIEAISMSADALDDSGTFPEPFIERSIRLLEKTGRPMTGNNVDDLSMSDSIPPEGSQLEEPPIVGEPELSPDASNAIFARNFPALAAV